MTAVVIVLMLVMGITQILVSGDVLLMTAVKSKLAQRGPNTYVSANLKHARTHHSLQCAQQCATKSDCYGYVINVRNGACRLKIYGIDLNPNEAPGPQDIRYKV